MSFTWFSDAQQYVIEQENSSSLIKVYGTVYTFIYLCHAVERRTLNEILATSWPLAAYSRLRWRFITWQMWEMFTPFKLSSLSLSLPLPFFLLLLFTAIYSRQSHRKICRGKSSAIYKIYSSAQQENNQVWKTVNSLRIITFISNLTNIHCYTVHVCACLCVNAKFLILILFSSDNISFIQLRQYFS